MDIKDDTSVSVTTKRVPTDDRKRIWSGGGEDLDGGRSGAGSFTSRAYTITENDLPGLCGDKNR